MTAEPEATSDDGPTPPPVDAEAFAADHGRDRYEGFHYEWAISDDWREVTEAEQRRYVCRRTRAGCKGKVVGALMRSHRTTSNRFGWRWWFYCADHLYGRVVHDGAVWGLVLRHDDPSPLTPPPVRKDER